MKTTTTIFSRSTEDRGVECSQHGYSRHEWSDSSCGEHHRDGGHEQQQQQVQHSQDLM